jgi:hypothetical protein
MPLEYFYNGNLRWSFYWPNPNAWAAFLVPILIVIWALLRAPLYRVDKPGKQKYIYFVLLLVEFIVWFFLVKTYSRGGAISALVTAFFFFIIQNGATPISLRIRTFAMRAAAFTFLMLVVNGAGRYAPDYLVADSSVKNRLNMWQGALAMIYDSPFRGWGFANSGQSYVNWYQPLEITEQPICFVNSYLDIAVEQGIHVLGFVFLLFILSLGLSLKYRNKIAFSAAGACILSWLLANFWSSLWTEPILWICPSIAMLLFTFRAVKAGLRSIAFIALVSLLISVAIVSALWFGGSMLAARFEWSAIRNSSSDVVTLTKRREAWPETFSNVKVEIWADGAILGSYHGRGVRSLVPLISAKVIDIYPPWHVSEKDGSKNYAYLKIYTGFHANRAFSDPTGPEKVILLHPTGFPDDNAIKQIISSTYVLCMPNWYSSGYRQSWRSWASRRNIKIEYSPQSGQCIFLSKNMKFWEKLLGPLP